MNYIVMECHPGYVVLLDEEGRFLKAANLRYEVGQTVYNPVLMREEVPKIRRLTRWIQGGAVAAAACFLLLFGNIYYQNYMKVYSSVYLSINPQVQMDLNKRGAVMGLTGTNADGETLLAGYDSKGKDKVTVADELVDRAIDMGYLSEGGQVSFSIDTPEEALVTEYGAELRAGIEKHLDGRITITIEILNHGQQKNTPKPSDEKSSAPTQSETPAGSSAPANNGTEDRSENDGVTDYNDTDYGPNNDGVTEYIPPVSNNPPISDNGDLGYDSDYDLDDDDSDDDDD